MENIIKSKEDLRHGDICITESQERLIYVRDTMVCQSGGFFSYRDYNDDLTYAPGGGHDIIKVIRTNNPDFNLTYGAKTDKDYAVFERYVKRDAVEVYNYFEETLKETRF